MKLGDNSLNNERLFTFNDETSDKKSTNCSPYFTTLQYIYNLETENEEMIVAVNAIYAIA